MNKCCDPGEMPIRHDLGSCLVLMSSFSRSLPCSNSKQAFKKFISNAIIRQHPINYFIHVVRKGTLFKLLLNYIDNGNFTFSTITCPEYQIHLN